MKLNLLPLVLSSMVFLCGALGAAPDDPVLDYGFKEPTNGKIKDRMGNATLTPGKNAKLVKGPTWGKGLAFDGTADSVSALELSKAAQERLDGFDFTLNLWFRIDKKPGAVLANGKKAGGDTGFGLKIGNDMKIQISFPLAGAMGLSAQSPMPLDTDRWYNLIYWVSFDRNQGGIYLDGELIYYLPGAMYQRDPMILDFKKIGNFCGALADVRMWDRVVPLEELTSVQPDTTALKDIQARLNAMKRLPPEFAVARDQLSKEVGLLCRKKQISLKENKEISDRISSFFRMSDFAEKMTQSKLKDAPFMFMEVKAISPIIRLPSAISPDAVATDNLRVAAAKNEFESLSFVVMPYRDLAGFEAIPGDFQGPDGAVIPASAMDRKIVKCRYTAGWNNFKNGVQTLLPSLLLNDDKLMKVDELQRRNYLRIDYPEGSKYCFVNQRSSQLEAKPFPWGREPVSDAAVIQPIDLKQARAQQFWFTVHVPKDAKPGLYTSRVKMKADGKPAGEFTITLRVYPFELPKRTRTKYDPKEEFLFLLGGGCELYNLAEATGDLKLAEKLFRLNLQNELDHGFLYSSGGTQAGGSKFNKEMFQRDMAIRKELGFPLDALYSHGYAASNWIISSENKQERTPEYLQECLDNFKNYVDKELAVIQETLGHRNVYFYGYDEADEPFILSIQSMFVDYLQKCGANLISTGQRTQYSATPAQTKIHAIPTSPDGDFAQKYHAIRAKLLCYAGPFSGPDNPHLLRFNHGLRNYYGNIDGVMVLWYTWARHQWNDACAGDYRNMMSVTMTTGGPINTLAFEGTREAIDDVKYATLFRQVADECFDSGKFEARQAAAKAVSWFELCAPGYGTDLDRFRMEMAEQIIFMMKQLGREVK